MNDLLLGCRVAQACTNVCSGNWGRSCVFLLKNQTDCELASTSAKHFFLCVSVCLITKHLLYREKKKKTTSISKTHFHIFSHAPSDMLRVKHNSHLTEGVNYMNSCDAVLVLSLFKPVMGSEL